MILLGIVTKISQKECNDAKYLLLRSILHLILTAVMLKIGEKEKSVGFIIMIKVDKNMK